MPDHDVIVVGAGPVGLLTACLLAQRGLDVVVCEKHGRADTRTRAIGIHPPGLDALDAAGVGAQARAEGLRLTGGDVFSRGRMLASVDFAEERSILMLPQRRTGALLRGRLAHLAPAALRFGCTALSLRDERDFVRLTVDSGGVRSELTASLLVVADGVRSVLRGGLDAGWRPRSGAATYAMADLPDADGDDRARLHCEPAGLVESFPLPGGMRRWVARQGEGPALGERDAFRTAIEERIGTRLDLPSGLDPVVFRAAQHRARRTVLGRVVLLGDAAHEVSPIGGQGMNLGWVSALRLAAAIGDNPEVLPDLGAFGRRNARMTGRVQRRARFYMSMGASAEGTRLRMREGLIRVLGAAPVRGRTADLITMGRL